MRLRRKLLLTFLGLGLAPPLLLAGINYWRSLRVAEASLQTDQELNLTHFSSEVGEFLTLNKHELSKLSRAKPLVEYLASHWQDPKQTSPVNSSSAPTDSLIPSEVQTLVSGILNAHTNISIVGVFKSHNEPLFVAEQREFETYQPADFYTKGFAASQPKPDERVWTTRQADLINSHVSVAPFGSYMLVTVPIFSTGPDVNSLLGALVAQVRLDPVFSDAARADKGDASTLAHMFIVLDRSGRVVYHTNEAAKHEPLNVSMPNFPPFADRMLTGETGRTSFVAKSDGVSYATTYARLPALDVFVAQASNYEVAMAAARRSGSRGIIIALLIGMVAAGGLALSWQRKARGIERVSEGVEAMAQGKLDHRIDLRSRDDLKPLADNLEVMTRQLRDQLAREAETQQFQSFVRLSAVLTHDLKNAIEALSLTVSNMERHSENAEFRGDAMKTLRGTTDDLRALVARLSNPVTTLSGEHKLPRPADLVPVLRRVISRTAIGGPHEIDLKLPESLVALVDVDRIDKVVENLIINAREAMAGNSGTITLEAGLTAEGRPFFSVSDTGEGMSRRFIEERLFHPFATTKKRGVGLGLYTCREVVRANGGSIQVASETGVGTTFTVVLPSPPTDDGREIVSRAHHR